MPQILLSQILHNYSSFNVNTIDSFFQKILKAFTRETGLNSNFNIELNLKQILELSIEQFFENANNNPTIKERKRIVCSSSTNRFDIFISGSTPL